MKMMDSNENMENESAREAKRVYVCFCAYAQLRTCHTCPQPLNRQNLHNPFEFSLFLLDGFCNWIFFPQNILAHTYPRGEEQY